MAAAEVVADNEASAETETATVPDSTTEVPLLEPYEQTAGEMSTSTDVEAAAQENSQGW